MSSKSDDGKREISRIEDVFNHTQYSTGLEVDEWAKCDKARGQQIFKIFFGSDVVVAEREKERERERV